MELKKHLGIIFMAAAKHFKPIVERASEVAEPAFLAGAIALGLIPAPALATAAAGAQPNRIR